MGSPQQEIDSYLGIGFYDEWKTMSAQERDETKRYEEEYRKMKALSSFGLFDRIEDDLRLLGEISTDYDNGMNLAGRGGRPNKEKLLQVHDLFTEAVGTAELENDVLEALWWTGFAAAWILIPWMLVQAKANLMKAALEELETQLKEAEKEARNAKVKTAIHGALTVFEIFVPEVSLLGRAGIYLGEVVVNHALGPDRPTTFERYEGDSTPGVKQFSEAVHHIPEYSHEAHAVAQKVGKVATVATFYFDYEEITEGSERVEKLEELTEKVKRSYDDLLGVLQDNRPQIELFLRSIERALRAIDDVRATAGNVREALEQDITRYQYSRSQQVQWAAAARY